MAETMTEEQMVDAVYQFAAQQMKSGVKSQEIEQSLVEKGLDAESARIVVSNLEGAKAQAVKSAAQKNMLFGALWCVGGTAVTAITYSAASNGGGSYVVAWGAILFGGIQFLQGLFGTITKD